MTFAEECSSSLRVRRLRRARPALIGAALVSILLSGCTGDAPGPAESSPSTNPSQLAGLSLYIDPEGNAVQAEASLRASGDDSTADLISKLADQPTATWFGGESDTYDKAKRLTTDAAEQGKVAILTAYNLPERDCGQYSKGGAGSNEDYLAWAGAMAAGIEDREAVVILEPDAIAHAIVGCSGATQSHERYGLLSQAVDIFKKQPNVRLYIDAGNASWVKDTRVLADALLESGVQRSDGFALNVSNFEPTDESVRYGLQVSDLLAGQHFVVDTSRNGAAEQVASGDWCNPSAARVGQAPTVDTGQERVDAYLWIKQPGDSDGTCNGGPAAGQWWPDYAQKLASR